MFEASQDQAAGLRRLFGPRNVRVLPLVTPEGAGDQALFAVNLAAALARLGQRALLLDGERGQVVPLLGLKARYDLIHLVRGDRSFHHVALPAREGFWVMPAHRGLTEMAKRCVPAEDLYGGFGGLDQAFDVVLACGSASTLGPLLAGAPEVSLVCGTEAWQVAMTYSQIKLLNSEFGVRQFRVAYCRATSAAAAAAAHERLASAAARFLGVQVMFGGVVENDPTIAQAERQRASVFVVAAGSDSARNFERIASASLDWPLPVFGQTAMVH